MERLQGIKNFAINIKPIMVKIRNGKKPPTTQELHDILQFYLEVVDYLAHELPTITG